MVVFTVKVWSSTAVKVGAAVMVMLKFTLAMASVASVAVSVSVIARRGDHAGDGVVGVCGGLRPRARVATRARPSG